MIKVNGVNLGFVGSTVFSTKKDINLEQLQGLEKVTKKDLQDNDAIIIEKEKITGLEFHEDKMNFTCINAKGLADSIVLTPQSTAEQKQIIKLVHEFKGQKAKMETKESGFFSRAGGALFLALFGAGMTAVGYFLASSLNGEVIDQTGRHAGKKEALNAIFNTLGPTGTLAVGGVITLLLFARVVKKNKSGYKIHKATYN